MPYKQNLISQKIEKKIVQLFFSALFVKQSDN